MTEYLMGLATLPALALLCRLLVLLASPPNWDEKGPCPWCDTKKMWIRAAHPRRPWWAWEIFETAHQIRYREGSDIRAWRAEHTEKKHWWSRRVVVR